MLTEIAKDVPVDPYNLSKALRKMGCRTNRKLGRPRVGFRTPIDEKAVVAAYLGGESDLSIAKRFGVFRPTVRSVLRQHHVTFRSRSVALFVCLSRPRPGARKRLTAASHIANQNIPTERRREMLTTAALGRSKMLGAGEVEFKNILASRGIPFCAGHPLNTYNIDFLVGSVAVELLFKTGSGAYLRKRSRRTECLNQAGYTLLCVKFGRVDELLAQIDEIIRIVDETNRHPAALRKNRMIRCSSERFARGHNQLGYFTIVPAPVRFFYTLGEI